VVGKTRTPTAFFQVAALSSAELAARIYRKRAGFPAVSNLEHNPVSLQGAYRASKCSNLLSGRMSADHLVDFWGKIRKTNAGLAVFLPEEIVNEYGICDGESLEFSINRSSFTVRVTPSNRHTSSMRLTFDTYRQFQGYFPEKRYERFLVEIDGESTFHHLTDGLTISGFSYFYICHPKLTRVRWRVLIPKKSFRLEYNDAWTD
jgi:hypothetical protein